MPGAGSDAAAAPRTAPSCPGPVPSAWRAPESGGAGPLQAAGGVPEPPHVAAAPEEKKAGAAGSREAHCAAGLRETKSPELKLRNITSV